MEVEPLRFEDGALLVLDQRALPEAERWIRCETVEEVADCIRTLAVRGAPAIGLAAAYGMALADGREDEAAELLRSTRPTAVNLAWALEQCRGAVTSWEAAELLRSTRPTAVNLAWALEQCRGAGDVLAVARRLHREQDEADRRLAGLGAELFESGTRALTHCNAGALATGGYGTACGVLRAAWDSGRLAEVWVDETRPLLQGARLTAWELRQAGIPHRVVADSAAGSLMARGLVDRVVVGADRIAANGDVANKVGTYPLAVLAARHDVPFYVAAPLSTIDPTTPDGGAIPIEERDSERGARGRRRVQPGVRRDPRGARDGDRHRGRRARGALSGVDRASARRERVIDADELLSRSRRPLVLGIGGGGDVVGALATAEACRRARRGAGGRWGHVGAAADRSAARATRGVGDRGRAAAGGRRPGGLGRHARA